MEKKFKTFDYVVSTQRFTNENGYIILANHIYKLQSTNADGSRGWTSGMEGQGNVPTDIFRLAYDYEINHLQSSRKMFCPNISLVDLLDELETNLIKQQNGRL